MAIQTDGPLMEPENKGIDEFHVGYGASLRATAAQAWEDSPVMQMLGLQEMDKAKGQQIDFGEISTGMPTPGLAEENAAAQAAPRVDMIDAIDRVKKAGLASQLKLPDQPDIPEPQLKIMMDRAQRRQELDTTIERGPQGFVSSALSVGTSFAVGAVDPLNIASAFIPVVGELRYGKILASAGDSLATRLAARAGVGAAEGAVGQAALEPLDWWSHTQDGRDFGAVDVLHNIMFGAALGGGLHAGGGFISDAYRRRVDRPLFPYDLGEPLEQHPDWNELRTQPQPPPLPRDVLGEFPGMDALAPKAAPAAPAEVPRLPESPEMDALVAQLERDYSEAPSPAVNIINDLPPRAHEDAMRGAIASLIDGEPVRAGEMLEAAAQTDPRIAESFRAFHGSPADFESFDATKINTGEGAQSYGHGLYFAENDEVARRYQRTVSDKAFVNKVAELYDEGFSPPDAWNEIKSHWSEFSPGEQRLMLALERDDWFGFDYPHQAVNAALRDLKNFDPSPETVAAVNAIGNLYRVKIKADKSHMLDWDRGFEAQSPFVRDALRKLGFNDAEVAGAPGKEFHTWLAKQAREKIEAEGREVGPSDTRRAAAARLAEVGIPGIKYLDRGSRAGGEHTQNFVVFNDKDVEITHKNGEPVKREELLAERNAEKAEPVATKKPRGRAAADPKTWSLFEFLAREGGLKPDPELAAIFGSAKGPFVPGFGPLVRPKGRALDDALRLAKDHGYMFDAADVTGAEGSLTPRDLLDRIAEENSGRRQYRGDQEIATKGEVKADLEQEKHEIIKLLHEELESASGIPHGAIDPRLEDRVVEIVRKEGAEDVLGAFERAIMEDAERYEGLANARAATADLAHIPGWDVDDRAATQGHGPADPGERGAAGLPESGRGAGDGSQPRGAGEGTGPAAAPELDRTIDRDAAWHQLAQRAPDFDDPDIIAASKAAEAVKAPPSKLDERVTAAEKAEAYAKQMYDMFASRLPEGERARLDEMIADLDQKRVDQDTVSQRGAACLFEGYGET
ncbi:hypothetical protein SAMN05216337_1017151 [Bradyrhizobium brasilense]|uniref:Large polyvalent protein associated domain-containing protein n=1 Tax=Bradyrhizobium brasilense TaxID=1419277 RepID=A0A1G6YZB1_9BRAD|nr:hypothetical protein [Bradyrhizobium brasilense]SDD95651.1 hypothetical protein SAMN05216337_1017151 [Bradyrhizobium brasilense]